MFGNIYGGAGFLGSSPSVNNGLIYVNSAEHTLISDEISVIQQHYINVALAEHSITSDNLDLIQNLLLVTQNTTHGHSVDAIAILQQHLLAAAGATHDTSSTTPTLLVIYNLSVDGALHSIGSDSPDISEYTLLGQPDSASFGTQSDIISLMQQINLQIEDAIIGVSSLNIVKIINWSELGIYSGRFINKGRDSGGVTSVTLDTGDIYIPKGVAENVIESVAQTDGGILIPQTIKKVNL